MKLFRSKSENNKEPYDEFIATVKLCSGEEILTKVIVDYTSEVEQIIIDNPVICQEVRTPGANVPLGYKFEPWIKMSEEDVFVLALDKVITLSEIKDDLVIKTYNNIIEGDPNKIKTVIDHWKFTRKMTSSSPNWYLAEVKNS